jgi:NIPSNAP
MRYDIATLTIRLGTAAAVNTGIEAWHQAPEFTGTLLGVFMAEIGELNQIMILRGFADDAALQAERMRGFETTNPFGAGDSIIEMSFDSYRPFPWMKPVVPGAYGGVYEIRTYRFKHGGAPATAALWEQAMPQREAFSPLVIAMVALDGAPRFTHIWPYADLNARAKARADSVAAGIWPPKGGPAWLTGQMHSTIALPTAISPLK